MAVATANRTLPDTYYDLVERFPLIHILDDDHLASAHEEIDRLLREDLDEGASAYLEVLTDLVELYEDEHHPIPDASEADVLRMLMGSNGLTQSGLEKEVGISQSTISAVLNGTRSLTKGQVIMLAKFFHVPPSVFLPA
jgi:HTH-type transcriptional regulator / antitoxin HigA